MQEQHQAIIITDLGFGDAGKGTITDFLARQYAAHTVVRYNGGPQAAHNVVTADGQHHTFSQFGSATLVPGTRTLLSRFMLINPLNMLKEERHLQACGIRDAWKRLFIDRRALVITPFQQAINRLREMERGEKRHGSCGEGVGECMSDYLSYGSALPCAGDLGDQKTLRRKLLWLYDLKYQVFEQLIASLPDSDVVRQESMCFTRPDFLEHCLEIYTAFAGMARIIDESAIEKIFNEPGSILFEGAQGVLLDENYGFTPYTTWSTTTCANAETLLDENGYTGRVIRLGVLRSYMTRHGAGPLPTEDEQVTNRLAEAHNGWNDWQQSFRRGYADLVVTRYARNVAGHIDYLALTHVDQLLDLPEWKICSAYRYRGSSPEELTPYFQFGPESTIRAIKISPQIDLSYQERLTDYLWSCEPEYQTLPMCRGIMKTREREIDYINWLEEQLAIPIAIISHGPTDQEKYWQQRF